MQFITINRFEIVRDIETQEVALFFISSSRIENGAPAIIVGNDLVLSRGAWLSLKFEGLSDEHLDWIREAPEFYVNRTMNGVDEMSSVHLIPED